MLPVLAVLGLRPSSRHRWVLRMVMSHSVVLVMSHRWVLVMCVSTMPSAERCRSAQCRQQSDAGQHNAVTRAMHGTYGRLMSEHVKWWWRGKRQLGWQCSVGRGRMWWVGCYCWTVSPPRPITKTNYVRKYHKKSTYGRISTSRRV